MRGRLEFSYSLLCKHNPHNDANKTNSNHGYAHCCLANLSAGFLTPHRIAASLPMWSPAAPAATAKVSIHLVSRSGTSDGLLVVRQVVHCTRHLVACAANSATLLFGTSQPADDWSAEDWCRKNYNVSTAQLSWGQG